MSLTWDEVVQKPEYTKLSADDRYQLSQDYFVDVVAPQVKPEERNDAWSEFYQYTQSVQPAAYEAPVAAPAPESSGNRLTDVGVDLAKSATSLGQSAVGIAGFATGGLVTKGMKALGYDAEKTNDFLDTLYSDARKEEEKVIKSAKGFGSTVEALVTNPIATAGQVIGMSAQLLSTVGIAKVFAAKAATAASEAALAGGATAAEATAAATAAASGAATVASSITEGAMQAGQSFDSLAAQGVALGKNYVSSLGSGATTAGASLIGGKLGKKLGLGDVDAGVAGASGGKLAAAGKGIIQEGALEELPQSVSEQMWNNLALDRPIMEGTEEAAATGLVLGGVAGGALGAATNSAAPEPKLKDTIEPTMKLEPEANPDQAIESIVSSLVAEADTIRADNELTGDMAVPEQVTATPAEDIKKDTTTIDVAAGNDLLDATDLPDIQPKPKKGQERFYGAEHQAKNAARFAPEGYVPYLVDGDPAKRVLRHESKVEPVAKEPDLKGLPTKVKGVDYTIAHSPAARSVAAKYAADAKLDYAPPTDYVKVDKAFAAKVATAFEDMKHEPDAPKVREAYSALESEVKAQYDAVKEAGLKIEFIPEGMADPYPSPRDMTRDVNENNHMWVFPTKDGFGAEAEFQGNPMLNDSGVKFGDQPATVNDLFRAIHDYFGHVKEGVGFRADGEENAYLSHAAMFSETAQRALATETRGQNSWLNFGPKGEANRTAKTADTVFADQKIGLLPDELVFAGTGRAPTAQEPKTKAPVTLGGVAVPVNDKGTIQLTHRSNKEGLTELDPNFYGTGLTGAEAKRQKEDPKGFVPRTYYGVDAGTEADYKVERGLGKNKYSVQADPSKLYDYTADPLKLKAKAQIGKVLDENKYESLIKDAGFTGYFTNSKELGMVVAGFHKTAVDGELGVPAKDGAKTLSGEDTKYLASLHEQLAQQKTSRADAVKAGNSTKFADMMIAKFEGKIADVEAKGAPAPSANITHLRETVAMYLNEHVDSMKFTESKIKDKTDAALVSDIADFFGKRVVVFKDGRSAESKAKLEFNGITFTEDPSTILINETVESAPLAIFGHEFFHTVVAADPKVMKRVTKQLKPYIKAEAVFEVTDELGAATAKEGHDSMSEAAVNEELFADAMGDAMVTADFWEQVIKADKSVFNKVFLAIKSTVAKLKKVAGIGKDSKRYTDFDKVVSIMAQVAADYKAGLLADVVKAPAMDATSVAGKAQAEEKKLASDTLELYAPATKVLKGGVYEVGQSTAKQSDKTGADSTSNDAPTSDRVSLRRTGKLPTGITRVTSSAEAAHVAASLRKSAQENLIAIVLDSKGEVITAISHSVGGISSTPITHGVLAGAIASVPNADSYYIAHNHPTGATAELSNADREVYAITAKLASAAGIEAKDMLAVTYGGNWAGMTVDNAVIPARARTKDVPIVARKLSAPAAKLADGIKSIQDIVSVYAKDKTGVLLLDLHGTPTSFVPMSVDNMNAVSGTPAAKKFLKAIHSTNAAAQLVIVGDNPKGTQDDANQIAFANINALGNAAGIDTLNVFHLGKDALMAQADEYKPNKDDTLFFSRVRDSDNAAAEDAGIDMSRKARLARAKDMGFDTDTVYYHGTSSDIREFKHGQRIDNDFTFVTTSPRVAEFFASQTEGNADENIIPLYVRAEKTFDYETDVTPEFIAELNRITNFRPSVELSDLKQGDWVEIENVDAQATIKSLGYDSFYTKEDGVKNLALYNPNQLRSINAAFFTEAASSPNLLFSRKKDQVDTPEFKAWAGTKDTPIEPDDINSTDFTEDKTYILKAAHGTTHDISFFDAGVRGNVEGQYGAVNYFTSSESDADANYAGIGPDLQNTIDMAFERTQELMADAVDDAAALEVLTDIGASEADAKKAIAAGTTETDALIKTALEAKHTGGKDQVLEVFIKTEKPFVIGDGASYIDLQPTTGDLHAEAVAMVADDQGVTPKEVEANPDEYEDLVTEQQYELEDAVPNILSEAIEVVAERYELDGQRVIDNLTSAMYGESTITPSDVERILRRMADITYAEDADTGALVGNQVIADIIQEMGFDSILLKDADKRFTGMNMEQGTTHIHVFDEVTTNIKSATDNSGAFDAKDKRINFSRKYESPEQEAAVEKVAGLKAKPVRASIKELVLDQVSKARQRLLDQYDPLKSKLGSSKAWMLAHLSKSHAGALASVINHGAPYLKDNVIQIKQGTKGLTEVLAPLGGEADNFLQWMAANRADLINKKSAAAEAKLADIKSGKLEASKSEINALEKRAAVKERFMSDEDIKALMALNKGTMEGGKDRAKVYTTVRKDFEALHNAVVSVAVASSLVNDEEAKLWAEEGFYVPFYRAMEESDTKSKVVSPHAGPRGATQFVRQTAYKSMKGADKPLADLMTNTLMNWNHLISASLNNQAGLYSVKAAVDMGAATPIPESAKTADSVFLRLNGKETWFDISDPMVLEALTSLNNQPLDNTAVKVASAFKRALTIGVTASPEFKLRNFLRDSIHVMAVTPISVNLARNIRDGWKATAPNSDFMVQLEAGGGAFTDSGYIHGNDPVAIKRMVKLGKTKGQIITDPKGWLVGVWDGYQAFGARLENLNRAALAKQLEDKGADKLKVMFESRDVLDFTRMGSSATIRLFARIVPFLNARMQGLDKVYRSTETPEGAARLAAVVGTYSLLSSAIYLAMKDDDDYKDEEDWVRDTYHTFKLSKLTGGAVSGPKIDGKEVMIYIPRPFEVGAIASMVERATEYAVNDEVHGELFAERLAWTIHETFAMNPVPQVVKPLGEIYANRSSFTNRPIESEGLTNLPPEDRKRAWTSTTAIALSKLYNTIAWESVELSPIQVEHLVRGYLGWAGQTVLAGTDLILDPIAGKAVAPTTRIDRYPLVKTLIRQLPAEHTRWATDFYDNFDELNKLNAQMRNYRKNTDEPAKAAEIRADNKEKLKFTRLYGRTARRSSKLRHKMGLITRSKSLSADEKRAKLDVLNQELNELLRDVVTDTKSSFN